MSLWENLEKKFFITFKCDLCGKENFLITQNRKKVLKAFGNISNNNTCSMMCNCGDDYAFFLYYRKDKDNNISWEKHIGIDINNNNFYVMWDNKKEFVNIVYYLSSYRGLYAQYSNDIMEMKLSYFDPADKPIEFWKTRAKMMMIFE